MADAVAVKITADVVDLQTKFAVARAESSALSSELSKLARTAQQSGMTDELQASMTAVAGKLVAAKANVASLSAEMGNSKSAYSGFAQATEIGTRALAAFGVAMSAAALVGFGEKVLSDAAEIYHEAEVLGLTTDAYQAFSKSAMLAGVATDTVDTAIRKFVDSQGKALTGTGNQAKAFNDLGVSAKLPAEEALPAVAAALLSIEDPARRARDEVDLFGRSGQELNPALEQWAQGVGKLNDKLDDLGIKLDDQTVKAAHDAKIAMDTLWEQAEDAWAPTIVALTGLVAELVKKLGEAAASYARLTGGSDKVELDIPEGMFGTPPATGGGPKPNYSDSADAKKAAELARQTADQVEQVYEQGAARRIETEEQSNNTVLSLGKESNDQWLSEAFNLENQLYEIKLAGVTKREAADKNDSKALAKDQAEGAQLFTDYTGRMDQAYGQYLAHKAQMRAADLADFLQEQQSELSSGMQAIEAQYNSHEISAQRRHDLELQLTTSIETEVLKRLDSEIAGLTQGTEAYAQAMKEREKLQQQFNKDIQTTNNALVQAQNAQWQTLANSIKGSFNSALNGLISQGGNLKSFFIAIADGIAEAFLQMGEEMVEQWIMQQIFGTSTGAASAIAKIGQNAAVAGSAAFASIAAIPYIGPELAPAAGAAAYAGAMAYEGMVALAVGTNFVPNDMPAMIHQGERVIPAADNAALMAAVAGGGAGQPLQPVFNINAIDTQTGFTFMKNNVAAFAKLLNQHYQYNPSVRP